MEMDTFADLINSKDPIIARMATIVFDAKHAYEQGQLTKEQFEEIIIDATEIQNINKLTNNLDRKAAIHNAVKTILQILSFIPK